jgi:predicted ATPase
VSRFLSEYKLAPCITSDGIISVHRAVNRETGTDCILKLPAGETDSTAAVPFLKNEFSLSSGIESNGILRPDSCISTENGCFNVYEHIEALPLAMSMNFGSTETVPFLATAIRFTELLAQLHDLGITHRNLSPFSILKDITTGTYRITGFYISVAFNTTAKTPALPSYYTPNAPYIAPEQTGNVARPIDERTDIYALGAVLYEMLCGEPPFITADLSSLLYSHVARIPVPLASRKHTIPRPVSDIIGKMLEKNPADRYQSAHGALSDLEECHDCLKRGRSLVPFAPGKQEQLTRLNPVKTLHGRKEELQQLADTLRDAESGSCNCVLLYGDPGTGKTRLVEGFSESLDSQKTIFARGKCDASAAAMPYHALKEAIADLVSVIISQGEDVVSYWRTALLEKIGDTRELIADFIPEIRMIIGPATQRAQPLYTDTGTRFKNALIRFLRACSSTGYTLVLFIDDLQWADSALLNIIVPAFFDTPSHRLLFIGSIRPPFDNAVMLTESIVASTTIRLRSIDLEPLNEQDTGSTVAEALGLSPEINHKELGAVIYKKTNGNPFFVLTFLETLLDRNLLIHQPSKDPPTSSSSSSGTFWEWDAGQIERMGCTENVVDLILERNRSFPDSVQKLLSIASVLGTRFSFRHLWTIAGPDTETVQRSVAELCNAGILQYESADEHPDRLCFIHDRIREALYNRIPPQERRMLHLGTGRMLAGLHGTDRASCTVFDILKHLNPCMEQITDPAERDALSRLNNEAAMSARNANAAEIAIVHFTTAIAFLPENAWERDHEYRFGLELHLAECEFQFSRTDDALSRCTSLASKATTGNQQAAVDLLRMSIHNHRQEQDLSIRIGLERLQAMGLKIPSRPSLPFLVVQLIRAAFSIRTFYREFSKDKPVPTVISGPGPYAFRIMIRLWLDAFTLQKQGIIVAITTYLINTARTTGANGPLSVACCFWGIFLGKITGDPQRGRHYGTMAMTIADHFDDIFSRGITYFLYGSFFAHLEGSLDNVLEILSKGQQFSYEAGDLVSTSNSNEGLLLYQVLNGNSLASIRQTTAEMHEFLLRIGNPYKALNVVRFIQSWVDDLENSLNVNFVATIDDPEKETPLVKGILLFYSMFREVVAGDFQAALVLGKRLRGNPLLDPSSYFFYFFTFMHGLALSAATGASESVSVKHRLKRMLTILRKGAVISSSTTQPLLLLITAEYHRHAKNRWEALTIYRQAIEAARHSGFQHIAALSCERLAGFLQPFNRSDSRSYLKKAMNHYYEWGAHAKLAQLRRRAPDLLHTPPGQALSGFNDIDIQSLLKSYEAISNELLLERLLEKLIRIVMENSGASRGVLLLRENDHFSVRVEGVLRRHDEHQPSTIEASTRNIPLADAELPRGIISYVVHSREPVRLENAGITGKFTTDPYVIGQNAKSILCVPLVTNERIRGIIYLENNMTEGAFPPSRLQLLRLLCGQAIISIDNALFHEVEIKHLQSKVNPHFIFNALSSIAELCHSDPVATEDAIVKLSALYRYVLTAEMRLVSLGEELDIVDNYIAIEQLRFGSRLAFKKEIYGNPELVQMPSMLIQPLVENSIKHGITPRTSGGTITVSVTITGERCTVSVADDGVGTGVAAKHGSGYGLESIRKRLALQYRMDARFTIDDSSGYRVEFSFPLQGPNH